MSVLTGVWRRELGWLELAAVVAVASVLAWVALDRMERVLARAERATVTTTLNQLRTALMADAIARLVNNDHAGLAALARANPVHSLPQPPLRYAGERSGAGALAVEPGSWYYDPQEGTLVYRVIAGEHFRSALSGLPRARFRVSVRFRDRDGDGRFEPPADSFDGIDLVALEPYEWRPEAGR